MSYSSTSSMSSMSSMSSTSLTSSSGTAQSPPKAPFAGDLQLSALSFSDVKTNDANGRKTVFVNYDGGRCPAIQTPWLNSWGVDSSEKFAAPGSMDPPRYSLTVCLGGADRGSRSLGKCECADMLSFMKGMEDKMVQLGVEHSLELFKKRGVDEIAVREAMLNPLVRTNGKDEQVFKMHLNNYTRVSSVSQIHTDSTGRQTAESIAPEEWVSRVRGKMQVRAVLQVNPLYFISGSNKFGCKWVVTSMEFRLLNPVMRFHEFLMDTGAVPTALDVPGITFSDIKVDPNNAKKVYLNAPGGGPLRLQTPWLTSFDGIQTPPAEFVKEGDPPKYSIRWSLRSEPEEKSVHQALCALDQRILEYAQTHSVTLFKKKMSIHVVQALYTPLANEEYPAFKAKTPCYDGQWGCAAYNDKRQRIDTDLQDVLKGRHRCRAIVQCRGLWFFGGRFGCGWEVKQLEYETPVVGGGLNGYAFRDGGDDDVVMGDVGDTVVEEDDEVVDSDME